MTSPGTAEGLGFRGAFALDDWIHARTLLGDKCRLQMAAARKRSAIASRAGVVPKEGCPLKLNQHVVGCLRASTKRRVEMRAARVSPGDAPALK